MNVVLNREVLDRLSPRGILAYVAVSIVGEKATPEKMAAAIRVPTDLIKDGLKSLGPLQNLEKPKAPKKTKPQASAFALPEWINKEAWDGYEEMRRSIKKPMTDRARTLAVAALVKLEKQGCKAEDVLNQSTMNCYQGLFPLREEFSRQQATAPTKLKETEFRL